MDGESLSVRERVCKHTIEGPFSSRGVATMVPTKIDTSSGVLMRILLLEHFSGPSNMCVTVARRRSPR